MSEDDKKVQINDFRSFLDDTQPQNPFAIPPDEKIFTFKEEEKQKRLEEREKNRTTKIWDKNKPIREGCLKKLCGQDIHPAAVAIDHKLQKKIQVSEAAGFTIPVERPRNKENRWKLIEKKREMDLIQEMIVTKREETKKIEEYEEKRLEALDESEKFLSQDIKSFVDFFKKNTQESKAAIAEADAMKNKRIAETKLVKDLEESCQKEVSKINKSIESLEEYYKYKIFLDGVNPSSILKEDKEENKGKTARKQETKESDRNEDKAGSHKKKEKQKKRNDFLDEIKCSDDLNKLIDDDNFEYKIEFENPEDLLRNFTVLEEKNLFLIQQTQDAEQTYEEK